MRKKVTCPACGAVMNDPDKCQGCGFVPADLTCFADQAAHSLWKSVYVPPKPSAEKLIILSQSKLATLNPKTHTLSLYNQFERLLTMSNVRQFSMSASHWVALMMDGHVEAGDDNTYQQCAVGDLSGVTFIHAADTCTYLIVDGLVIVRGYSVFEKTLSMWSDIVQIAAGEKHVVGLKSSGEVLIAASDSAPEDMRARLVRRTPDDYVHTYRAPDSWQHVIAVEAGDEYALALTADGEALALGMIGCAQLALAWTEPIVSIAASRTHAIGLTGGGTLLFAGKARSRSRFGANLEASAQGWTQLTAVGAAGTIAAGVTESGDLLLAGRPAYASLPNEPHWNKNALKG